MPKFPRSLAAVLTLVFLAGCASTTTTWTKKGITPLQGAKDLKLCAEPAGLIFDLTGLKGDAVAYSSKGSYENYAGAPFEKCMMKKGYRKKK